jgi:hypothetical protein
MKLFLVAILLVSVFAANAQPSVLKFKDGTSLEVVASELSKGSITKPTSVGQKTAVTIKFQSFEGTFLSSGKAIAPLSTYSIQQLKAKHRELARDVLKIHSGYEFTQNDQKFYIAGLGSVSNLEQQTTQCYETKACLADFNVILVELKSTLSSTTIVILKSIKLH